MNNEEPYRDQAEKLRQKIEKVNESNTDVKHLPPRGDLHRNKKKKTKVKLKYPLIRLLVLFFILLPVTIFSVYSYLGGKHGGTEKVSTSSKGYETIDIEKSKKIISSDSNKKTKKGGTSQKKSKTAEKATNKTTKTDDSASKSQTAVSPNPKNQTTIGQNAAINKNTQADDKGVNNQVNPAPAQSNTKSSQPAVTIIYHKVQPKENLYRIALKYYHSKTGVETIKEANHLPSENISVGQVLKIPLNK